MAQLTDKQREAYELFQKTGNRSAVARELNISTTAAEERITSAQKKLGTMSSPRLNKQTSVKGGHAQSGCTKPMQSQGGLSREEVRAAYDVPHRLSTALDSFIEGMTPGYFYEENEVKRACKVSNNEIEYWNSITAMPERRHFYGYTETGARLWATKDDIEWAAGPEGITGFVPGVEANWN